MTELTREDLSEIKTELHKLTDSVNVSNTQFAVHLSQSCQRDKDIKDHDIILRGEDRKDGLIADVHTIRVTQIIVDSIIGAVGLTALGGVLWLIENAMSVASNLSKLSH
jgi:hypothetical protein